MLNHKNVQSETTVEGSLKMHERKVLKFIDWFNWYWRVLEQDYQNKLIDFLRE